MKAINFNSGEYRYAVRAGGTVCASVIDKNQTRYAPIPRAVEHEGVVYPVTSLRGCFCGCRLLTEAPQIPDGVTDMARCFCGCASLTKAPEIPESVTDASSCFYGCRSLGGMPALPGGSTGAEPCVCNERMGVACDGGHVFRTEDQRYSGSFFRYGGDIILLSYEGPGGEVKVPEGVNRIGSEAFAFCSHVTGVILPESVQYISSKAFYRSGIRTVSLPDKLLCIDELAFSGTPLESVDIPDQVTAVGERAFAQAARLKRAKLPEGLNRLESGVFTNCFSLKDVVLPKRLQYINTGAFRSCTGLEGVALPEGLVAIGQEAFCGCSSLREIFLGDSVKSLDPAAFKSCATLEKVRIPEKLRMTHGNAFENNGRMALTGPGQAQGLIIDEAPEICYDPVLEKAVFTNGVVKLPQICTLWGHYDVKILDLPRSLKYFSWYFLARLPSLTQIVTDRDATAAEIALLLGVESVDREGRRFTFSAPIDPGAWIFEPDAEYGGVCLTGRRGRAGAVSPLGYVTVIVPGEIEGRPVTSIGSGLFDGCDYADAFYVPDTVKRIGSLAFAHNVFCMRECGELFMRMPEQICVAEDAFEGTKYTTRAAACKAKVAREKDARRAETGDQPVPGEGPDSVFAVDAADDPAIGTGACGRPALQPNIWQYLDRLSRQERVWELTHSFTVWGGINGVGWAWVRIRLDGHDVSFRISDIGRSLADFRRFAGCIEDGESESFVWTSEPGGFPWRIQRRGRVFYVEPPLIEEGFFIAREQFLSAIEGLTDEW